eukprot:2358636-Prymnesium_polylepis.1
MTPDCMYGCTTIDGFATLTAQQSMHEHLSELSGVKSQVDHCPRAGSDYRGPTNSGHRMYMLKPKPKTHVSKRAQPLRPGRPSVDPVHPVGTFGHRPHVKLHHDQRPTSKHTLSSGLRADDLDELILIEGGVAVDRPLVDDGLGVRRGDLLVGHLLPRDHELVGVHFIVAIVVEIVKDLLQLRVGEL